LAGRGKDLRAESEAWSEAPRVGMQARAAKNIFQHPEITLKGNPCTEKAPKHDLKTIVDHLK